MGGLSVGHSFHFSRLPEPWELRLTAHELICPSQFGGKLVTFESVAVPLQQGAEQQRRQPVFISQVVTEKDFLNRSAQLQHAVQSQGFIGYCQKKIEASQTEFEKNVWSFLKVKLGLFLIFVPVCVSMHVHFTVSTFICLAISLALKLVFISSKLFIL